MGLEIAATWIGLRVVKEKSDAEKASASSAVGRGSRRPGKGAVRWRSGEDRPSPRGRIPMSQLYARQIVHAP